MRRAGRWAGLFLAWLAVVVVVSVVVLLVDVLGGGRWG